MDANDTARLMAVLEQIRDNQAAALAMQKEQFELVRRQVERAERIQDRAEELQEARHGHHEDRAALARVRAAGRDRADHLPQLADLPVTPCNPRAARRSASG